MKKKISAMEPEVDVFKLGHEPMTPTDIRYTDFYRGFGYHLLCKKVYGDEVLIGFREEEELEIIGRIGPDGTVEEMEK